MEVVFRGDVVDLQECIKLKCVSQIKDFGHGFNLKFVRNVSWKNVDRNTSCVAAMKSVCVKQFINAVNEDFILQQCRKTQSTADKKTTEALLVV